MAIPNSVFISGSISIKTLPAEAKSRLDTIMSKNMQVLIGDAPGVDRLVQSYLAEANYRAVMVYGTDREPRNNVGAWPYMYVYPGNRRGRDRHAAKDEVMTVDAQYGLMIYDGSSLGTRANMERMKACNKQFRVVQAG